MRKLFLAAPILCALAPFAASTAHAHAILHADHAAHAHGAECGHEAIEHDGHVDYLHDGHLHHAHESHVDEHMIAVSSVNPDVHELSGPVNDDHAHGHQGEEHAMVQHGSHMDYVHDGRLHHAHGDHFDDHGPVKMVNAEQLARR
ncbi:MAG: hypothetical protein V2I27_14760 [Erythrobacter sp.]|jgi:hypothetical protein|nr:hypothetical protein [Erythrobacter sp.]